MVHSKSTPLRRSRRLQTKKAATKDPRFKKASTWVAKELAKLRAAVRKERKEKVAAQIAMARWEKEYNTLRDQMETAKAELQAIFADDDEDGTWVEG